MFLVANYISSFSQNNDSLYKIFNDSKNHDTIRLIAIDDITWNNLFINPDSAINSANVELRFALKTKQKEFQAYAHNHIGTSLYYKSKYPQALTEFFKSLKLHEEIKNTNGIITVSGNIGNLYLETKEYKKAIINFNKCLELLKGSADNKKISTVLANLGLVYHELGELDRSLEIYLRALKVLEEINFKEGIIVCYINIGNIYVEQKKYDEAITINEKGLKLAKEINYPQAIAGAYFNLASIYWAKNEYKKAIQFGNEAVKMQRQAGDLLSVEKSELLMSSYYEKVKDYNAALKHYKIYVEVRDSIFNEENTKSMVASEMNFEFEKKQAVKKAEQDKLDAVKEEELKRQKTIGYAFTIGFILVLILVIIVFRSFRQKQKTNILLTEKTALIEFQKIDVEQKNEELNQQNEEIGAQRDEIEKQKHLVDDAFGKLHEKNKEVMDSIMYASRIQRALLTNEKYIARNLEKLNEG